VRIGKPVVPPEEVVERRLAAGRPATVGQKSTK
jgi:hypothetical protein